MQNYIYFLTIFILIIIAYIDFKTYLIPLKYNIAIACVGIVNLIYNSTNILSYLISTIIIFILLMLGAYLTDGGIGGGDIQLFTALTLIVGKDILYIIMYTSIIGTIFLIPLILAKKLKLKSGVALAPFIMLGTLTHLFL